MTDEPYYDENVKCVVRPLSACSFEDPIYEREALRTHWFSADD